MRERLTLAFVVISLVLLAGAGAVRSVAIDTQLRREENQYLAGEAGTIAAVLPRLVGSSGTLNQRALDSLLQPDLLLTYTQKGRDPLVARGSAYEADTDGDAVRTLELGSGRVLTVARSRADTVDTMGFHDWPSLLGLLGLLALVAGALGYWVARSLSRPFRQLAQAAAALGRGRFDLDLPRTRVPEARAIARALESSAVQLRERLEREREFGLQASHLLRTPLTSLRFHLEELVEDPALSAEARTAALDGLRAVGRLNRVTGELVDASSRGVLVAGAAMPLRDIATQIAQRWADALELNGDRTLTAAVEGDIELAFTPGPIEQVLDVVFTDVVLPDAGPVRVVFEGAASRLRIDLTCGGPTARHAPAVEVTPEVVAALRSIGGSVEIPSDVDVLRLHLPRR